MEIRDDPENHRYVVEIDGAVAGFAVYHMRGGRHFFVHTEIDSEHEGHGVGTALAQFALDDVRAKGGTIVPICPFIAGWIDQHTEYRAIVDQQIFDRINRVSKSEAPPE